jgi:hypothetical protein
VIRRYRQEQLQNPMEAIMRSFILSSRVLVFSAVLVVGFALPALAQVGPPGGMIYAHDEAYRVIATPRDLPNQGPFDTLYFLGSGLAAVSESAPGDPDYNGGRWEVRLVDFLTIPPTQFTNAEDVLAAAAAGEIAVGDVARRFVCPLIEGDPEH